MEDDFKPQRLIEALKFLAIKKHPKIKKIKVLFCGTGSFEKDLKYLAYDSGLGNQVFFLHQDVNPFIVDLYSASDFIVKPRPRPHLFSSDEPLEFLEACATGVVPVCSSYWQDWMPKNVCTIDDDYKSLSRVMEVALDGPFKNRIQDFEKNIKEFLEENFVKSGVTHMHLEEIGSSFGSSIKHEVPEHISEISGKTNLKEIEFWLSKEHLSAQSLMTLYCKKGVITRQLGQTRVASESFLKCLEIDPCHLESLSGLGYVYLQEHAYEKALNQFKKVVVNSPNHLAAISGIATVHHQVGLLGDALCWYEKALSLNAAPKERVSLLTSFSEVCKEFRDIPTALVSLERVTDIIGDIPQLIELKSYLSERKGL